MQFKVALLVVVCTALVTAEEHPQVLRHICEQTYGAGWRGAVHTDNNVICIKVFNHTNNGYAGYRDFCAQNGAQVAPVANEAEQTLIQEQLELLGTAGVSFNHGVYLGAVKTGDMAAGGWEQEFKWEFDNEPVGNESQGFQKFLAGEPNSGGDATCIAMFPPGHQNGFGNWFDVRCNENYAGAACAKLLFPK